MTSLTTGSESPARTPTDQYRQDLADLLELAPEDLPDQARLVEDVGLDSLAMMSVTVWLGNHGVVIEEGHTRPARVADVLSLIETAAAPELSLRLTNGDGAGPASAADVPVAQPPERDPLAPVLSGHGLQLDPVTPDDVRFLYSLAVSPETRFRWRYRGSPPSLERFTNDLWNQIVVQFVVRRTEDRQPVGHVMAYGADPTARYVYMGAVFVPAYTGSGVAAQAVRMFVRYLFHTFPLVKVYIEIPGYNWPQVASGEGALFEVEGVLRDHHFYAGRCWDQYVCAVYRDRQAADSQA